MNKNQLENLLSQKKLQLEQLRDEITKHEAAIKNLKSEIAKLTGDCGGGGEINTLRIKVKQADLHRFTLDTRGDFCLLKETPKRFYIARFGINQETIISKDSAQGKYIAETLLKC